MGKYSYMQNRELSWLNFNERVLEEAERKGLPLYERLNFVSIFTSNLDEFFMIRVGSLQDLSVIKSTYTDNKTGMNAKEQIGAILKALPPMYEKKDRLYKKINEELRHEGIFHLSFDELTENEKSYCYKYFKEQILPLISPQIIDKSHPFPFLENKKLYIFIEFKEGAKDGHKFGLIPVRDDFNKFIKLPSESHELRYVLTEDLILNLADNVFEKTEIENKYILCVTRNFDLTDTDEIKDEFDDYMSYMKAIIKKRQRLTAVRVESSKKLSKISLTFLCENLKVESNQFFTLCSPINMDYVSKVGRIIGEKTKARITNSDFNSYNPHPVELTESYMQLVEKKDIILSYPYDDIQMFLSLIKEASNDKNVLSIKITIYRLAKNSKLVKYLSNASENGIEVTVFMELKARFDEENNINYSKILYEAGCNIIYGFEDYKIHSKICLITYKKDEQIRYITQIGTGNYNENTSKLYTDISFITADHEIGKDASEFFYNMGTGKIDGEYSHLLQSPSTFKKSLLSLMDEEIAKGENGRILCKMNSLTDKDFIEKISEASNAGVDVKMVIRGICCILPNIDGKTENVEVESVVGRFLEHSRIYIFSKGDDMKVYIASADLMTRNTEKRVEIGCPIYDKDLQKRLEDIINIQLKDTVGGRIINKDGKYDKKTGEPFSSQEYFMEEASMKNKTQEEEILMANSYTADPISTKALGEKNLKSKSKHEKKSFIEKILDIFRS